MKGIVAVVVFAMTMIAGTGWAAQFGPPEPTSDPGKFSLGVGYWSDRSRMKMEGGQSASMRSNQYYLQGNYSFLKDWEVYGRAGASDLRLYDRDTARHFSDGAKVFGSVGLKGAAYRYKNFAIGPFIEGSMYADHDGVAHDQWDVNVGVTAQYKVPVGRRDLTVYGGPFAYWRRAETSVPVNTFGDDMKEKHNIGGFIGVKVPVVQQKIFFTAEAQMRDRMGAGVSLSYKF
jgi:hypothetical protein